MKKIFRRKKKSASEVGSIASSGLSGSAYNISPKKDLGKLHKAAFEGNLTKLKSLLKRGDVNQLDKENRTPLHLACANGKYDAVRMLCEHPNVNLNLCDNERRSALMKCVQCEHLTCLKILLDKEADVSLCDENGNTALHIAASIPNSDICHLLSECNADPMARNKDGATALHIAASLGSDEIVEHLLGSGVDVDDADDNNKTALMLAAHKGHLTTVKLLMSKNANSAIHDISGWTADDYASMNGFHSISHIITDHSAKQGRMSTPSRGSTTSVTPRSTPQKPGLQTVTGIGLGGPAMDVGDANSESEDSFSESKAADNSESWASSTDSEEDEPKQSAVQKKSSPAQPKINIMQALNLKNKSYENAAPASPETASQPPKPLSRATANAFLTASARKQLKTQESEDSYSEDDIRERDARNRCDSESARGEPVSSPGNRPRPMPRSVTAASKTGSTQAKYTPSKTSDEEDSSWDSSDDEGGEPQHETPAEKYPQRKPRLQPDQNIMQQLGFDKSEMKNILSEDSSNVELSLSEAKPAKSASPAKAAESSTPKKASEDLDSWDDSFSEKEEKAPEKKGFNFLDNSSGFKFDDETDSEADVAIPVTAAANRRQNQAKVVKRSEATDDSRESSSWCSDLSPSPKPGMRRMMGTAVAEQLTDDDGSTESDFESEGSWERENRMKKAGNVLNNEMDLEKERKIALEEQKRAKKETEEKRKREEEETKRVEEEKGKRETEEKKRLEERLLRDRQRLEEEERRRVEEAKRKREAEEKKQLEERLLRDKQRLEEEEKEREVEKRKLEEVARQEEDKREAELRKKRELEDLEKLNMMNEELERKNAELKKKAQEEERKKREEEEKKLKLESAKVATAPMNNSLRVALERAVDASSESSDSDDGKHEDEKQHAAARISAVQANYVASLPPLIDGHSAAQDRNHIDLDTLTEETGTDDDLSLSEGCAPAPVHTSQLSDSLKLAEEKQSLTLQLARERDAVAMAQERLEAVKRENKDLKSKERTLADERARWELERVETNAENRKLGFDVKNLEENLETIELKLTKQDERCKRMEGQLRVEREERKEQEVLVRDLRIDLKNSNALAKQSELECEELRKKIATEKELENLTKAINEDNHKLNETMQNEAMKDNQVEALEQVVQEKNHELIKVKAERDRYEDASVRYKDELGKLRSQDADQHGNLVQLNQELNERLDEKEAELRDSEEALQLTALQSMQLKQAYENAARQLEIAKRDTENALKDSELLDKQQAQLKCDLEESRSSLLREQERLRSSEESREQMREKEVGFQDRLLSAETKASRLENELHTAQFSNKQRAEDVAKWENECEKLRQAAKENEKDASKLQKENAEQSGTIKALKIELQQRESECILMRQEKEDTRSRNTLSANEQQEDFNSKLGALQREHENERVAFETRNVQLEQQIEHWRSQVDRIDKEKAQKDEELAQAQQDRIETHKKLGYADAFSKSASKEQKHLMEENSRVKEENMKLQSQVSLLEQKVEEKSSSVADLQKEVDSFYQTSANANRKIDSLSESQRLAANSRAKLEQQLKDVELENIRVKSELESANAWKEKLQEGREEDAHSKAALEEKLTKFECDKILAEERLATEVANAKILRSELDGHKSMWETEVKSRSKIEVELSKAEKEAEDEKLQAESLRSKLTRALEERKTFKTKYEQLKREKAEANRRAESYRSAMHDAGRKAADTESECEIQLSTMDERRSAEIARRESTIAKLRERVSDLVRQLDDKKRPYFPEGPTENSIGSDEIKRVQFENDKLKEELRQLRAHMKDCYVDKSELEAARQEERIRAQATLGPTLDQVNSFLKNHQVAQEFRDQLIQKREGSAAMRAAMRIASLEEELRSLRRRQDDQSSMTLHRQEAEVSQLYEGERRKNEILEQQLARAGTKAEEYKGHWMKERKKFQTFFSNTLGGGFVPNGTDASHLPGTDGSAFSPGKLGIPPLSLVGAFSSTPKKDIPDPLLTQLRSKLDASIAQQLGVRDSPLSHSVPNGHVSSGSSAGTPRSDGSSQHRDVRATTSGLKSTQNEYMSFLLT